MREPGEIPMGDPLAFLLTWTTYGTWLPGDDRGWVARPGQMRTGEHRLRAHSQRLMEASSVTLDPEQRKLVERTVADHCEVRGWILHAVNCRTQHVHAVITAVDYDPAVVLAQLKAWCSRRLDELQSQRGLDGRKRWWTTRGSKRWLFSEKGVFDSVRYVVEGQD